MSKKGDYTTSDYLPYADYQRLVQSLIDEKKYWWAAYCILSFCTGLRFSDVSRLKWDQILEERQLTVKAQKTKKTHIIPLGINAQNALRDLYDKMDRPDKRHTILAGQSGESVSIQYINRNLKSWIKKYNLNIENFSTHTFRKTFGRYVYEKSGHDEKALLYLNRIFKHANLNTTMIYLGIRDDEIATIYNSLEVM